MAASGVVGRSFEAIVVDWDSIAGDPAGATVGAAAEELVGRGVVIIVWSSRSPGSVRAELGLGPQGTGELLLWGDGGRSPRRLGRRGLERWTPPSGSTTLGLQDALDHLWSIGVGPGLVLVVGKRTSSFGARGASRYDVPRLAWAPAGDHLGLAALLSQQVMRRREGRCPGIDEDPRWSVAIDDTHSRLPARVRESLFSLGSGALGTRGVCEDDGLGHPLVVVPGVYDEWRENPTLLEGPNWTALVMKPWAGSRDRRVLDLRTGVLLRERTGNGRTLRTVRFLSLARPGAALMRAEGPASALQEGTPLYLPNNVPVRGRGGDHGRRWAWSEDASGARISAVARSVQRRVGGTRLVERVVSITADPSRRPRNPAALAGLRELEVLGFDRLLAEHRAAWAQRWDDAEISIEGDPEVEIGVRYALFHLFCSVPDTGEAAVGPRGLSGPAYGGHVMWDADVFVMPAMAATHPASARAMIEYRLRRLPEARRAAVDRGFAGARFPWESGRVGTDITPRFVRNSGQIIPIRTGGHEEHVVADVAWAADQYVEWTGDTSLFTNGGEALLLDTARYWVSRVRFDRVGAHIYGVVGPDEYHELVDDNTYTNVMARWNLRRAAAWGEATGAVAAGEVAEWRRVADALVDGYEPVSGRYEQFAGFWGLQPLLIGEVVSVPVLADEVLGREFIRRTQVNKQPDVLMLHHMVAEEIAPGSLGPDVAIYLPRTAHGSSLSPAICAAVLARAGRPDEARELFALAARLDLDDVTGTTAGGLHTAAAGGVWQALVQGFMGVRPRPGRLAVDPVLPARWRSVEVRVRYRGRRVRVQADHAAVRIWADGPVPVEVAGGPIVVMGPGESRFEQHPGPPAPTGDGKRPGPRVRRPQLVA